ncbi:MAG: hypothetical protein VW877_13045 [Pseudomonadaceae bacterium]
MPTPSWLSLDDAEFISKGLSISLASRDLRHVPSIARGLACCFSTDGCQLVVLLSRRQNQDLLRDITASGQLAVVFTEPSSHRTLQIKGSDAWIAPLEQGDLGLLSASRRNFGADILPLGFDEAFNRRLFANDPDDLCRVLMTPTDVFQQTPGANAGQRIGPAPCS